MSIWRHFQISIISHPHYMQIHFPWNILKNENERSIITHLFCKLYIYVILTHYASKKVWKGIIYFLIISIISLYTMIITPLLSILYTASLILMAPPAALPLGATRLNLHSHRRIYIYIYIMTYIYQYCWMGETETNRHLPGLVSCLVEALGADCIRSPQHLLTCKVAWFL